jgi:hypothetical protein
MISGISIYEDPTMNIDDKRILIGTINTTEQYNVAKYLGINCDDKYKTILRDNFINTNISYKPHMSFMTLKIKDENNNIVC